MASYPRPPRSDDAATLHGTRVEDPFRPLERPDDPAVEAWVKAEGELTEAWLARLPQRAPLRKRLSEIMNYPRQSPPWRRGGLWLVTRNSGLENQDRLFKLAGPTDAGEELLDPNRLSTDGTVALLAAEPSPDGRRLAYMLSRSGSDWAEVRVRDVATGAELTDLVEWVKFSSLAWAPDGSGFYYSRYDAPAPGDEKAGVNRFQKLYLHRLGTGQDKDELVHETPSDGEVGVRGEVTHDGRYLILTGWRGSAPQMTLTVLALGATAATAAVKPHTLVGDFLAEFHFVGNDGERLYFKTTYGADRGRLVALPATGTLGDLTEVIPEAKATLEAVYALKGSFVARYLDDAASALRVFDRAGRPLRELPLPGVGTVSGPAPEPTQAELFFTFESFATPPTVYRTVPLTGESTVVHRPATRFDPDAFETRRVFVTSPDGTKLPLFLAHKKGLRLDGTNPTLLYGYGGFNAPVLPWFRMSRLAWMEMGGVYASACLRGGGEYGESWHEAGTKAKKQNVFDDFIAAAAWLTAHGYTRRDKLAINGGSNGGLLVGACMTQRPELWGAVVAAVGVFDMLRFHKFTIGWAWTCDYGSPDDPADFRVLRAYSPLHNVKAGTAYPPTLITTADHDDRVVPAHSYKFAAALQAAQAGEAPVLLRVERKSGHGQGKPVAKLIEETADIYAFLCETLGVTPAAPA